MRFRLANPGSLNYLGVEPLLNNLKLVSVNSGTELALASAIVDSDGNIITSFGGGGANASIGDGRKVVASAGTSERLSATSVSCKKVTITAETDNTDYVVVGGSTVVAALSTRRGTPLGPGDSVELTVNNLNLIYIDALTNGDGVTYHYEN